jgi:hypothetical protein
MMDTHLASHLNLLSLGACISRFALPASLAAYIRSIEIADLSLYR